MFEEYAGIVITPDAVRDSLVDDILRDLREAVPMEVVWQKRWRVADEGTVLRMYPRLVGRPSYGPVIRTMTMGECIVMIARGENLYARLQEAKGRFKFNQDYTEVSVSGLRFKYRTWQSDELTGLKSASLRQVTLEKVFEYRLHTTDDLRETAQLCMISMSREERESLKTATPPLYEEVSRLENETV